MRDSHKIKQSLHSMIDKVTNDDLLTMVYQILESKVANKEGQMLDRLTLAEKEELYKAYSESLDDSNLIDLEQFKKDHPEWPEK